MKEIFDLQWSLNKYTLANIGSDFEKAVTDPERKPVWLENYRKAFSAELAELVREVRAYGPATQNGKVEVVDMLHFLVSLSQVVGLDPPHWQERGREAASFDGLVIEMFLALDDLQNSVKWKWWAQGGGFKEEKARSAVWALWDCFQRLCVLSDLDFDTLKRIYVAKNQVNFKRQNDSYNEDTKTEADNRGIEF